MTLRSLSAYGKAFQVKVLSALLTNTKFLLNVRDLIKEEYFDNDAHKWILDQIIKYFDKYHTIITQEVLKVELQKISKDVLREGIKEELRSCYISSQDDTEYVIEEFTKFCRNQAMKQAILDSTDLLKEGDFDGIRQIIENAIKAGIEKDLGHEYSKDVESRYREDSRKVIPTPWPVITQALRGGFGNGDLIIFFGGPGGGKSWMCIAAAAHAAALGYNVNYYTLELSESYVGKRVDCNLTGIEIDKIDGKRALVEELTANLKGNIIIKEYPPKRASVNTIQNHIRRCKDLGQMPDLVIVDYADYLQAPSRSKLSEKKDEIDDVYIGLKGLAKHFDIPCITPSQVNRMGAKDKIIEGDKAAGSYDKIMIADFSFSLSRQKEDKILGRAFGHIMKNRYGRDGRSFEMAFDTGIGKLEFVRELDSEDSPVEDNISKEKVKLLFDKVFEEA